MFRLSNFARLPALRLKQSLLHTHQSVRLFSQFSNIDSVGDLEKQANKIKESIETARKNVEEKTRTGLEISRNVSKEVPEDKFIKQQRYEIFIQKMEQLAEFEEEVAAREKQTVAKMESAFVQSGKPIRDILKTYNQASRVGFEPSLITKTLESLNMAIQGRGWVERPFEDYGIRQLDQSWRMQGLRDQLLEALSGKFYYNHQQLGKTARQLGVMGYKDNELIQAQLDKLNQMLDGEGTVQKPIDLEQAVYGGHQNFVPRHYVFEGFAQSEEFNEHLKTLMEWQVDRHDVLASMGIEVTESVQELEVAMAQLINAATTVRDLQVNMQASIDSLRQQYLEIQAATDKNAWLNDNQYIRLELAELQEKLIRAGYVEPSDLATIGNEGSFAERMDRASQIFYNYASYYVPDLLSKQYEDFARESRKVIEARAPEKPESTLGEQYDNITIGSLSQALIGVADQVMSYRREAHDKDYLHAHYEELLTQRRAHLTFKEIEEMETYQKPNIDKEVVHVQMEREYLKAYSTFAKGMEEIAPKLLALFENARGDTEGTLRGLLALSKCKLEAPELREKALTDLKNDLGEFSQEAAIDGLHGIALQNTISDKAREVASLLASKVKPEQLTLDQKINFLWSSCAIDQVDSPAFRQAHEELQDLQFERITNDLTYDQAQKVRDYLTYLTKLSAVKEQPWAQDINSSLRMVSEDWDYQQRFYPESKASFDPFRKRILEAVSMGLTAGGIENQIVLEENLLHQGDLAMGTQRHLFPVKPDLTFGYHGHQVMLNVIRAGQTMSDEQVADGEVRFRQRLLEGLHGGKVTAISVPIDSVVDLDIGNLHLALKPGYNLDDVLRKSLKVGYELDFGGLAQFGSNLSNHLVSAYDKLSVSDRQQLSGIVQQLHKVFEKKQNFERQFENELRREALGRLKVELVKLDLACAKGSLVKKVNELCPSGDLASTIEVLKEQFKQIDIKPVEQPTKIDLSWQGVRQTAELPQLRNFGLKKNLAPEIIDQKFMWVDDYFHYSDWKQRQQEVYDNFNLLVIPRDPKDTKYYMDRANNQRIVPQGIFPNASAKRQPKLSDNPRQLQGDDLSQLNSDPIRSLVTKEMARAGTLDSIMHQTGFMTNLQNLKQGIKQDYDDKALLDLLLFNSNYTDKLIDEHLQKNKPQAKKANCTFIQRDPTSFREFQRTKQHSKYQEDPFTHFYLGEAAKQEKPFQMQKKIEELKRLAEDSQDVLEKREIAKLIESMEEKIDDQLLANYDENRDELSLVHQFESETKVDYDVRSLMQTKDVQEGDPDLESAQLTDQQYLHLQRRRAETKLIKTKIIFKHSQGKELTTSEKKYLDAWLSRLNRESDLSALRDTMVPRQHSTLNISDGLFAEDVFALNQVPGVDIDLKKHGKYALSDIVLELSHFLDDDFTKNVELALVTERIRKEWDLPEAFQLVETRNKEVGLVMQELEELSWRMAGQFDDKDMEALKNMFSIGRNKDSFDRAFFEQDMESMRDFMTAANKYDGRIQLLQEWLIRKEKEIKSRVQLPPKSMQSSDQTLFSDIDKGRKVAREAMVGKLLEQDAFGNKIAPQTRTYEDLTTPDLNRVVENLSVRLSLFDQNFPAFMPQLVRAIMEHPSLARTDYQLLDNYCSMFGLDWRGDRGTDSKQEWLSTNPVYLNPNDLSSTIGYGQVGPFEVTAMMRSACQPYLTELAASLAEAAKK